MGNPDSLSFLDRDRAVMAYLVDDVGYQLPDLWILGGDGSYLLDLLFGSEFFALASDYSDDLLAYVLERFAQCEWVGPILDVLQSLMRDRVGQDRCRCGSVACLLVRLLARLFDHRYSDVLNLVFREHLTCYCHSVVCEHRDPAIIDSDVPAFRSHRDLDGVGYQLHPFEHGFAYSG